MPRIIRYMTILLTLSFAAAASAAETSDAKLRNLLLGAWTIDRDHPGNDVEREAVRLRIFGITQYESDGRGATSIYTEKLCGRLVRQHTFRWDVKDGILTASDGTTTSKDRILSVSKTKAVLVSVDGNNDAKEFRLRIGEAACR